MSKLILTLALLLAIFGFARCDNWAVLVAGSDQFYNYRHQADVFHAYQALLAKGMDPNKIIVMAYDDIASSSSNPYRGQVFNKPTYASAGVDVYKGVKIDYKGANVTPAVFLNVLLGNKTFVAGKGTGRVLESTPNDNVFIFFSDHGAPGLIAFPNEYLYVNDLSATLNKMSGKYNKLVFYLETCESGSMFVNLPKNTKIYAVSAAGTDESSWATYCSPDDVVGGKHIGTCLGDLFSVSFIEDIDSNDISTETLDLQFQKVKKLTNLSKVMQWGDTSFVNETVNSFIGQARTYNRIKRQMGELTTKDNYAKVSTYHIKINYLSNRYARTKEAEHLKELLQEMNSMQKADNFFYVVRTELDLTGKYDAAVLDAECLKKSIDSIEEKCGKLSEYSYQYIKLLAENCQMNRSHQSLLSIIKRHC